MTKPVVNGAQCKCDKGSSPCLLATTAAPSISVEMALLKVATVLDHVAGTHLTNFGTCKIDGEKCTPITPLPWIPGMVQILLLGGAPILTALSLLMCRKGGTIKIVTPGQATIDIEGGLNFDGHRLTWGDDEWPAISGPWGNGKLPPGVYSVDLTSLLESRGENDAYVPQTKSKTAFFVHLLPDPYKGRTELGIHPDGNVKGTLGCIGITNGSDQLYRKLKAARARGKNSIHLQVKYR